VLSPLDWHLWIWVHVYNPYNSSCIPCSIQYEQHLGAFQLQLLYSQAQITNNPGLSAKYTQTVHQWFSQVESVNHVPFIWKSTKETRHLNSYEEELVWIFLTKQTSKISSTNTHTMMSNTNATASDIHVYQAHWIQSVYKYQQYSSKQLSKLFTYSLLTWHLIQSTAIESECCNASSTVEIQWDLQK